MDIVVVVERLQEFAGFGALLLVQLGKFLGTYPISLVTTVQPFWVAISRPNERQRGR